jgi:hypothetical protein
MAGDFDISDGDVEVPIPVFVEVPAKSDPVSCGPSPHSHDPDFVVAGMTLLNTVIVVTKHGKVWRMSPTLVHPTWDALPDVPR